MNEHKELGRIQEAHFGMGGYQNCMLGLWLTLGGKGWGVSDGRGAWSIERSEHAKWTEADRIRDWGEVCAWLNGILSASGKSNVAALVGVPIEATFDSPYGKLVSWRVLSEVLP